MTRIPLVMGDDTLVQRKNSQSQRRYGLFAELVGASLVVLYNDKLYALLHCELKTSSKDCPIHALRPSLSHKFDKPAIFSTITLESLAKQPSSCRYHAKVASSRCYVDTAKFAIYLISHYMAKTNLTSLAVPVIVLIIVVALLKVSGVTEAFECWCRDGSGDLTPTGGAGPGDVTAQLKRFTMIVSNSKWMVGTENGTDRLFYARLPLTSSTVWKSMPGLLEWISLNDNYLLGTNRDSTIYATDVSSGLETAYSAPAFWNVPGGLYRTALLGKTMYGINNNGQFYRCNPGDCRDGKWSSFPGAGMSIASDPVKNVITTRGTDNKIYVCSDPCNGSWTVQS